MGLMWILPLLVFVIFIALLLAPRRGAEGRRESAREVLDRRYASGEISREQYEEMKRTIS
jgi:putative membrane protein